MLNLTYAMIYNANHSDHDQHLPESPKLEWEAIKNVDQNFRCM